LLAPVAAGLVAGSAHRQLARSLGCAPSTVTRLAARIGRHSLLLHSMFLERIGAIDEPVVLDHFETFVYSQDDGDRHFHRAAVVVRLWHPGSTAPQSRKTQRT
jgi:hypothetical protein